MNGFHPYTVECELHDPPHSTVVASEGDEFGRWLFSLWDPHCRAGYCWEKLPAWLAAEYRDIAEWRHW